MKLFSILCIHLCLNKISVMQARTQHENRVSEDRHGLRFWLVESLKVFTMTILRFGIRWHFERGKRKKFAKNSKFLKKNFTRRNQFSSICRELRWTILINERHIIKSIITKHRKVWKLWIFICLRPRMSSSNSILVRVSGPPCWTLLGVRWHIFWIQAPASKQSTIFHFIPMVSLWMLIGKLGHNYCNMHLPMLFY